MENRGEERQCLRRMSISNNVLAPLNMPPLLEWATTARTASGVGARLRGSRAKAAVLATSTPFSSLTRIAGTIFFEVRPKK